MGAGKLADQIPRNERRITQREVSPLWNRWELFVVFIGAVSAEWFIRRRTSRDIRAKSRYTEQRLDDWERC